MALRKIVEIGDEALTKTCKPVKKINDRTRMLAEDMAETMRDADGVGLAAPQVGVLKRIFVATPDLENPDNVVTAINPEIIEQEGQQDCIEGCLSVPGYVGEVKRPKKIKIKYQDLDGEWHEDEYEDFAANVMCHEYDHLNGIMYTERADRMMTNEEYEKILEEEREKEAKEEAHKKPEHK